MSQPSSSAISRSSAAVGALQERLAQGQISEEVAARALQLLGDDEGPVVSIGAAAVSAGGGAPVLPLEYDETAAAFSVAMVFPRRPQG